MNIDEYEEEKSILEKQSHKDGYEKGFGDALFHLQNVIKGYAYRHNIHFPDTFDRSIERRFDDIIKEVKELNERKDK